MELIIDGKRQSWQPRKLVIAGYTGRDQAEVKKHIEELERIGIAAPPQVPMLYDVAPDLLSTNEILSAVKNDGSGEAEVVLMDVDGTWYVGIGSDHTDRVLEAISIQKSKQICSKPVTAEVWALDSFVERWDEIEMNSWVTIDGVEELYQSGTLSEFMTPDQLLEMIKERKYYAPGMAILCGTLPLRTGEFVYGNSFRAELKDPKLGRTLTLNYQVKVLQDAEEE